MNIFAFDKNLVRLGFVEIYESLRWNKGYNSVGDFSLKAPASENNLSVLTIGNFLWRSDDTEFAVIETLELTSDSDSGNEFIEVSGKFASSLLGRRIIWNTEMFHNADIGAAVGTLIADNAISPTDTDRMIDNISYVQNNLGYLLNTQVSYKNLLETIETWCVAGDIGYRSKYDINGGNWVFELYQGSVVPAVFSNEYENVLSQNYTNSYADYANVALVKGESEGNERSSVTVGSGSGVDRYEIYVDARDLQTDGDDPIPEDEYEDMLTFRGQEKLAEHPNVTSFDGEINTLGNLRYKTDFNVGDIVKIVNRKWGVVLDTRIVGVTETFDVNGLAIDVTFGQGLLTLTEKIKRGVR
jgi:hypothetical protein